ncbi:MAG: hypothetical protein CM1200mP41_09780 [Gammaproteobacteria bacterium]|nr:MAG: hypothetical protein CM1200mP41_09780 [Gammaproteobacteria bacterium]
MARLVPTISNAVPWAGVAIGIGIHPARIPPGRNQQLDRNLSLVVIHAERAVIVSITHLEIEGVAGEGAGDIDLMLFGLLTAGWMMSISSRPMHRHRRRVGLAPPPQCAGWHSLPFLKFDLPVGSLRQCVGC